MNVEVHLQRIRKGKPTYTIAGIVPSIEVESYQEVFNHPEVQQMIQQAKGKHFNLTMYVYVGKGKYKTLQVAEVELKKVKAL